MPPTRALPPRATALLLALTAGLLLFRLGAVPLLGPDEPRYARVAVEMWRAGEWVTPTLQGRPWLEKPVLYYWLAGAAYGLFGETEAAARLPSVAAAVLMVGTTALVGARLYGSAAGLHAGFVLATALLPFAYGRAASMDMLLAALVTAAIGLLALGLFGIGGRLAIPAAWLACGLAVLAKGPLGLLLPGLVITGYALATRDARAVRRFLSPAGIGLFLLVALPWHALILIDQGRAFVDVFLLDHNLARFTSTIHRHPGPPWFYIPVLAYGLFPWSGLMLAAAAVARPRGSRDDLFVLLWFALPFAFFSAAGSKLPGYVIPCLAPLALFMGKAADALVRHVALPRGTGARAVSVATAVLAAAVVLAPFWLRRTGEPLYTLLLPVSVWTLLLVLGVVQRLGRDAASGLALLRVGAAGLLVLIANAAPPLLAARETGRIFFMAARGREVLAWGAWRTAWMAGYFYNDGRVRPVETLAEILAALDQGPALVLCGPDERRRLETAPGLSTVPLVQGPRRNALLRVARR